jgi:hypothetical protein
VVTLNPEAEIRRKKLTRFLCQELLYEFANGGLTSTREKEMREYIEGCRDSQREFEKLKRGHDYSMRASGARMSPALGEALLNFEPQWQKQLRIWTLWSSQRGWKMLPYLVLALTMVAGLVVFKPWQKVEQTDVILAEQMRVEPDMFAPAPAASSDLAVDAPPQPAKEGPDTSALVAGILKGNAPPAPAPLPAAARAAPTTAAAKTAEISEDAKAAAPGTSRGFIMRGELEVSDFANTWPMVRDKIIALGGKVAGNVELGWLRRPGQSYFHFAVPEANYPELELFLRTFGPVRFGKEKHPRVMPAGQIRIILLVKDSVTDESPPDTP